MSENNNNTTPKKTYDPGWNDPPKMEYSIITPNTSINKQKLNKRIAFPIDNSSIVKLNPKIEKSGAGLPLPFSKIKQSTTNNVNQSLPSTLKPSIPLLPPPSSTNKTIILKEALLIDKHDEQKNTKIDINFTIEIFEKYCNSIKSDENVDKIEDFVHNLKSMYADNKLNILDIDAKENLWKIATALTNGNQKEAFNLQQTLENSKSNCPDLLKELRQLIEIEIKIPLNENTESVSDFSNTNASATCDKDVTNSDKIVDGKKKMGQIMHI